MWKKDDMPNAPSSSLLNSSPAKCEKNERCAASIGQSITIKGEITGAEDLMIDGAVEGMIDLKQNSVVVGRGGRVKANIVGKVIQVHGEVVGDLTASEQIVIHESGMVRGNVSAPRVSLKDGARLKGAINTDADAGRLSAKAPEPAGKTPPPQNSKSHNGASSHAVI
jgi:cytoskeletal protein CcmA (bactofilin family)